MPSAAPTAPDPGLLLTDPTAYYTAWADLYNAHGGHETPDTVKQEFATQAGSSNPVDIYNHFAGSKTGTTTPTDMATLVGDILSGAGSNSSIQKQYFNTDTQENQSTATVQTKLVNVPTPEQFLDNFTNALTTHVIGLRNAGLLGAAESSRLLDASIYGGQLLGKLSDEYMAELGKRALAGQQIYKVPASAAGPQFGGGSFDTTKDTATATQTPAGGPVTEPSGGPNATPPPITDTSQKTTTQGVENIVQGTPDTTPVATYSGTDFLKEFYSNPGKLSTFVESEKYTKAAERLGPQISAPNRVQ
jgi:hypothetical protein